MNCDTGELYAEAEALELIENNSKRIVRLKAKELSKEEIDNGNVENTEIKELLCKIGNSRSSPRSVRRRLEKQLRKLRKKYEIN